MFAFPQAYQYNILHMSSLRDSFIYGTADVGVKGQIVIPIKLRKELGLNEGDTLIFVSSSSRPAFTVLKADTIVELKESFEKFAIQRERKKKANK